MQRGQGDEPVIASRKKLSIWSALPPYLGGKRRLCPTIFREIDRIVARRQWRELTFLDAFLGGGSVSLYAKAQGFRVVACDIAERSMVIGRALVENSRVKLSREDILRVLASRSDTPGRIEATMAPAVFTKDQARFLDTALRVAGETADPAKPNLVRLLALRTALLCHAYAQVRKGTIHRVTTGEFESITESAVYHYVDGLRLTTPAKLWELACQINAGVFEGRATVMKRSVLDALPEMEADVAYFDPPYPGVMSYEKEYKTIDLILEGVQRPTSPFTARDGANMIDGVLERARHIPVWVLSLGNAVVGVEELEAKMAKHGRRTKAIALKYQHLPAVATAEKKRENREFLVVGVDPSWDLERDDRGRDARAKLVADPVVEQHAGSAGSVNAAPSTLAGDAFEQRDADLTQQVSASFGAEAFPVGDGGIDDPHAVLLEGALDMHRELGLAGHDDSASRSTADPVKEES